MAFTVTNYGKFFYFKPDDIGQRIARGEFFDGHLRPYLDMLVENSVLVDVGANIGFHTIYAALCRRAFVYAFEASEDVFALLRKNVLENAVSHKVQLWDVPLYDFERTLDMNPEWRHWTPKKDGSVDYERSPNSGGLSLVPGQGQWHAFPLDHFNIPKCDLLKIDTQGSDLRVLMGATKTISRCRPSVIFEFEHNGCGRNAAGDTLADCEKFFKERMYSMKWIGGDGGGWGDYLATPEAA
jgi:FkbM family methyltransferase